MSLQKPRPVHTARERQYAAASGELQVHWGGIHE